MHRRRQQARARRQELPEHRAHGRSKKRSPPRAGPGRASAARHLSGPRRKHASARLNDALNPLDPWQPALRSFGRLGRVPQLFPALAALVPARSSPRAAISASMAAKRRSNLRWPPAMRSPDRRAAAAPSSRRKQHVAQLLGYGRGIARGTAVLGFAQFLGNLRRALPVRRASRSRRARRGARAWRRASAPAAPRARRRAPRPDRPRRARRPCARPRRAPARRRRPACWLAKHVRMAPHQLVVQRRGHIGEIEPAPLAAPAARGTRTWNSRSPSSSRMRAGSRACDRVGDFVGLLDGVRRDRGEGLRAIPRAAAPADRAAARMSCSSASSCAAARLMARPLQRARSIAACPRSRPRSTRPSKCRSFSVTIHAAQRPGASAG